MIMKLEACHHGIQSLICNLSFRFFMLVMIFAILAAILKQNNGVHFENKHLSRNIKEFNERVWYGTPIIQQRYSSLKFWTYIFAKWDMWKWLIMRINFCVFLWACVNKSNGYRVVACRFLSFLCTSGSLHIYFVYCILLIFCTKH